MAKKTKADDVAGAVAEFKEVITSFRKKNNNRPLLDRVLNINLREATFPSSNPDAGTSHDDNLYAPLETAGALDLPPQLQYSVQKLAVLQYRKNARANRRTEIVKDFVLNNGITIIAKDKRVQDLIDMHWLLNEWEDKMEGRLQALSIFGEQFYPAFTNQKTGIVRISSVTPLRIREILRSAEDAETLEKAVVFLGDNSSNRYTYNGYEDKGNEIFGIIRRDQETGELAGGMPKNAFFFAVNRIGGATRGTPDTLSSMDWLEGYDNFLWSVLERANIATDVVFDLLLKNADGAAVRKATKAFTNALQGGGIWGHNEAAELNVKSPNIGASEVDKVSNLMVRQIQAGTGLAGLFYGDSVDLTRAAASELSVPVARMIQTRQNNVKRMLIKIMDYQIQEAQKLGKLSQDVDTTYTIKMARAMIRDMTTVTRALVELSSALATARDNDWISEGQATEAFKIALDELGEVTNEPIADLKESIDPGLKKAYDKARKAYEKGQS